MWLGMLAAARRPARLAPGRAAHLARRPARRLHRRRSRTGSRRRAGRRSSSGSRAPPPCSATYAALGAALVVAALGAAPRRALARAPRPTHGRNPAGQAPPRRGGRAGDRVPARRRRRARVAERPAPTTARRRRGFGSSSSTSGRATRSCSQPADGDPVLVDAGPAGGGRRRELEQRGSRPARRARDHPPRQPITRAARAAVLAALDVGACCSRAAPRPSLRQARRGRHPDAAAQRRRRAALRPPAAARALAAAARLAREPRPCRRAEPALAGPAGALARLRDAAHRRRRGRARAGPPRAPSTCSRSPTTAARTPASRACSRRPRRSSP